METDLFTLFLYMVNPTNSINSPSLDKILLPEEQLLTPGLPHVS